MNILQVLPELNVGGVETGTLDMTKELLVRGHKAVVVSAGGRLTGEIEACGGIHYRLSVNKKSIFGAIKLIRELERIIIKEDIQIVHARSRVPAWIAYFAARRARRRFVTTCHGYYSKQAFSSVMGWGKRVIVLSRVIGRHMIEDFGVPYQRIRLIPRSVDLAKFEFVDPAEKKSPDFNIAIIGRITPLKGHAYFIKAMARASLEIPNLKLWIVGDAPVSRMAYKEQLRILSQRLGLAERVQFLGTQADIPAVLSDVNVLVLATVTQEAFGRVIIEAQAAGVPVVATRVGGVVDIIEDQKTGLLVTACDPQEMSSAVVRLYKEEGLATRLAASAYVKLKQMYTVDKMVDATLDVYKEALEDRRILVIKLSSLGDVILSTAALEAINKHFGPGYKISVLVSSEYKDVLANCPYVQELIVCDFSGRDKGWRGLFKLSESLRKRDFDIVVDLQNNRKSHILSALSLAPDRFGYDNNKFGFLLNRRIKGAKDAVDPLTHQFRVLKMLGIEPAGEKLRLWPSRKDQEFADYLLSQEWISQNQRLIGLNLSASRRWVSKNWPIEYAAELCAALHKRDTRIMITGTPQDLETCTELCRRVKSAKLINLCGRTSVNQLACLIKKCAVYVSSDSAPLHIAAAMGVPYVGLFGPTDDKRHAAAGVNSIVIKKDLRCRPCYRPNCRGRHCMRLIKPEEVLAAIDKLLSGAEPAA